MVPALGGLISIHSLRMEGDDTATIHQDAPAGNFNPLPPHGGRLSVP